MRPLCFVASVFLVWVPALHAQCDYHDHLLLTAWDGEGRGFGNSVDIDGEWMAVGAPSHRVNDEPIGTVYLFRGSGLDWSPAQRIDPPDHARGFGDTLALEADRLVIGAFATRNNRGVAFVYRYEADSWVLEQEFDPGDQGEAEAFGYRVTIEDQRIFVTSLNRRLGGRVGVIFVYERIGGAWQVAELIRTPLNEYSAYGASLAASGDWLLVGAPLKEFDVGTAHLYHREQDRWTLRRTFDGEPGEALFGAAVALDDEANAYIARPSRQFVFRRNGNRWREEASWPLPWDELFRDQFVAVDGGRIISGAPDWRRRRGGAVVGHDLEPWKQAARLNPEPDGPGGDIGVAVAIQGSLVALGAYSRERSDGDEGAVFLMQLPDHFLEASPSIVPEEGEVIIESCGAPPDSALLVAAITVQGVDSFIPLLRGTFDSQGQWSHTSQAPPGLTGLTMTLQCYACQDPIGHRGVLISNPVDLTFE